MRKSNLPSYTPTNSTEPEYQLHDPKCTSKWYLFTFSFSFRPAQSNSCSKFWPNSDLWKSSNNIAILLLDFYFLHIPRPERTQISYLHPIPLSIETPLPTTTEHHRWWPLCRKKKWRRSKKRERYKTWPYSRKIFLKFRFFLLF